MEQPLADVYFLVVMEHMMGDNVADMRLETALNQITSVNEVCWSGSEWEGVWVPVHMCVLIVTHISSRAGM